MNENGKEVKRNKEKVKKKNQKISLLHWHLHQPPREITLNKG
jgi:hypothetical protein